MSSPSMKSDETKRRKNKKHNILPAKPSNGLGKMVSGAASKIRFFSLSSTSSIAITGSFAKAGPSFLDAVVSLSDTSDMDPEEIQREHFGEKSPLHISHQNRMAASAAEAASEIEPITLDESTEVIDLTNDCSVVDLTCNDSLTLVEESRQQQNQDLRSQLLSNNCNLCSDDESDYNKRDVLVSNTLPRELEQQTSESSRSSASVSCPICMDGYGEIIHSGRLIMSTKCGHIFCCQCLQNFLKHAHFCPTCRKKLNLKQCHPIYI